MKSILLFTNATEIRQVLKPSDCNVFECLFRNTILSDVNWLMYFNMISGKFELVADINNFPVLSSNNIFISYDYCNEIRAKIDFMWFRNDAYCVSSISDRRS